MEQEKSAKDKFREGLRKSLEETKSDMEQINFDDAFKLADVNAISKASKKADIKSVLEDIEINDRFQKFLDMAAEGKNIFLTGDAGTGKSIVAQYFIEHNKNRSLAVLAPTGLAAVNIGGQTIHSFFKLKPKPMTVNEISPLDPQTRAVIKGLDTIIIDEVSMVRSDMMDIIDYSLKVNRNRFDKPFGGVQMIFIGDLNQLPPVVASDTDRQILERYNSPFFFDSDVVKENPLFKIKLNKVYRQTDEKFIGVLNAIKNNHADQEHLDVINSRYTQYPIEKEGTVTLCATNQRAEFKNSRRLDALEGESRTYYLRRIGKSPNTKSYIPEELTLKIGAQVIFIVNDAMGRFKNGTTGKVVEMFSDHIKVDIRGKIFNVEMHEWESVKYTLDKQTDRVKQKTTGSIKQLPVKLAWAISIHKSQGQTYDDVIIDFGSGTFAHGQSYVALSRCRTLDGIQMQSTISERDILFDRRVSEYIKDIV